MKKNFYIILVIIVFALLLATLVFIYLKQDNNKKNDIPSSYSSTNNDLLNIEDSKEIKSINNSNNTQGTRVKVTMNNMVTYAIINNTVTAQSFLELLPFHITGYRSKDDICCSVDENLPNNPSEDEIWNIGEIGWFGGWFTILCDNEEQFTERNRTIIGKFEDEYIDKVTSLKGDIQITIELEN